MKNKIIIIALILLSSFYIQAQNPGVNLLTKYYANGQIRSIEVYSDTVKNGIFIKLDANGRLLKQEEYLFGKLNGKSIDYEYGRVKILKNYKAGKLDGSVETYHSNRKLSSIENYADGLKNGESIWYYKSGKVFAVYNYKKGNIEGKVDLFYENGKLKSSYFFKDNEMEGKYVQFSENGIKTIDGIYKNGKKEGKWRYYDEKGKLKESRKYKNGEQK